MSTSTRTPTYTDGIIVGSQAHGIKSCPRAVLLTGRPAQRDACRIDGVCRDGSLGLVGPVAIQSDPGGVIGSGFDLCLEAGFDKPPLGERKAE